MPPGRRKPSGGRKAKSKAPGDPTRRSSDPPRATDAAAIGSTDEATASPSPAAPAADRSASQAASTARDAFSDRVASVKAAPSASPLADVPAKRSGSDLPASEESDPPAGGAESQGAAPAVSETPKRVDDAAQAGNSGAAPSPPAVDEGVAASAVAKSDAVSAPPAIAGSEAVARSKDEVGSSRPTEDLHGSGERLAALPAAAQPPAPFVQVVAKEPSFSFSRSSAPDGSGEKSGGAVDEAPLQAAGLSSSGRVGSASLQAADVSSSGRIGSGLPAGEPAAREPGGVAVPHLHHSKIKGGRWTVARFFLISCAYSSAWMAVASQMAYLRELHGASVLLHLNVAYFVPPVPLLVACTVVDARLEAWLGPAHSLRARLVFALVAYAGAALAVPRAAASLPALLTAVAMLGLAGGVAYSASYQLVSKFANKSVIALGLGFCASGPLVGALETVLGVSTVPTLAACWRLYVAVAAVAVAGCWASISVINRHRIAIDGVLIIDVPPPEDALENGPTPGGSRTLPERGCIICARDGRNSGAADSPSRGSREISKAAGIQTDADIAPSDDLAQPLLGDGNGNDNNDNNNDTDGAPNCTQEGGLSSHLATHGAHVRHVPPEASLPVPVGAAPAFGSASPTSGASPYEVPVPPGAGVAASGLPYVPPLHLPASAPTYVDPLALRSMGSNASWQMHAHAPNPALLHATSLPPSLLHGALLPELAAQHLHSPIVSTSYLHSPIVSTSASRRISTALSWSMADLVDTTLGDRADDDTELPLAGVVPDSLADAAGECDGGTPIAGTVLLGEDALVWQHHVEEEQRHEAAGATAALPGSRGDSGSGLAVLNDWFKHSHGDRAAFNDAADGLPTPRRASNAPGFRPPTRSASGQALSGRPPLPSPQSRSRLASRGPTPQPSSVAALIAAEDGDSLLAPPSDHRATKTSDAGKAADEAHASSADDEVSLASGTDAEPSEKSPLLPAARESAESASRARAAPSSIVVSTRAPAEDSTPPSRLQVARRIAPHLTVMFVSTFLSLMLFPLFTLVPSSGRLGEALAARLFFAKVFADVAGRFLPRVSFAKPKTPTPLLVGVSFKCLLAAVFVIYLRAPMHLRSDHFAVALVACIWLIGGWVNSGANMLAPARAGQASRAVAAGIVAIAFQAAHFAGLAAAAVVERTLRR